MSHLSSFYTVQLTSSILLGRVCSLCRFLPSRGFELLRVGYLIGKSQILSNNLSPNRSGVAGCTIDRCISHLILNSLLAFAGKRYLSPSPSSGSLDLCALPNTSYIRDKTIQPQTLNTQRKTPHITHRQFSWKLFLGFQRFLFSPIHIRFLLLESVSHLQRHALLYA